MTHAALRSNDLINLPPNLPGAWLRHTASQARELPGPLGDFAAVADAMSAPLHPELDRVDAIKTTLLELDPDKQEWVEKIQIHGDMFTVAARASELPISIVEQARRLNADIYRDHIFEPHLYEAALRLMATGKFNGFGSDHPLTLRAQSVLDKAEHDPKFFENAQAEAAKRIETDVSADDVLVIVMQDQGDGLQVVATTRIYSGSHGESLPTHEYFQVNSYPLAVRARQQIHTEEETTVVEIGRLARTHPMRPMDSIRATVAAYVATFDQLAADGMTKGHMEVIANTHSKLVTVLRAIGLPVDTIPDIELRPEVLDSPYAPFFVGRLCALLKNIEQVNELLPEAEVKKVRDLIEAGLDALHHEDRDLSDLKIEMITIPGGTALNQAVDGLRAFLEDPLRSTLSSKKRKRKQSYDTLNDSSEVFEGKYGQSYSALETLTSYQEMQNWIAAQVADDQFTGRVVDLGSGPSYVLKALTDIRFKGRYTGCEETKTMAEKALSRVKELEGKGIEATIEIKKMEEFLASQENSSLERVVAAMSLYTIGPWETQLAVLTTITQKMKPRGRLILTNPIPDPDLHQIANGHRIDIADRYRRGDLTSGQMLKERARAAVLGPILMIQNNKLIANHNNNTMHFPSQDEILSLESVGLHVVKHQVMYNGQANCWVLEKK